MKKTLNNLEKFIILTTLFLVPLIVLPISPNPFTSAKTLLLTVSVFLILIIKALKLASSEKLTLTASTFDFPILLLTLAYLVSAIIKTPNKMEAFLLPGTVTLVLASSLIYFFVVHSKNAKNLLLYTLITSATLFSVISMLSFSKVFSNLAFLPAYMRAQTFNTEGGYLPALLFLLTITPIAIAKIFSEKKLHIQLFVILSSLIIIGGIGLSIYNLLPGKATSLQLPGANTSWSIAIDSLKESPLLGIGPGNYLSAFNRFRPISYNSSSVWALKFANARSYYLTLIAETGLLGLAALILLLYSILKRLQKALKAEKARNLLQNPSHLSLVVIATLLAIFPASSTSILMIFVLSGLSAKARKVEIRLSAKQTKRVSQAETPPQGYPFLSFNIGKNLISKISTSTYKKYKLLPLILTTLTILILGRAWLNIVVAEYRFKKAIDYLSQNNVNLAYNTLGRAINTNPRVDRYHTTFSQVNLALANSLVRKVAQEATDPSQVSQEDRDSIMNLIQLAISEAKAAVALNPQRAGNWELLARTYQVVIPLANGAANFALQSYQQAIALDPVNPNLRIALGGVYYSQKDYDNAIRAFELATVAKPDLANAHYNLSFALRDSGKLTRAIEEMNVVLTLVDNNSNDFTIASKALEELQEKKKVDAQSGEELLAPSQIEESLIQPPLELPEGAEPPSGPGALEGRRPEAPLSPTPTPEESTTPTPSATPSPIP